MFRGDKAFSTIVCPFESYLSSVACQIEIREVIRVADTKVDDIKQVCGHVHH